MRTPTWLQRLESRIALALARASAGVSAASAAANRVNFLNGAPVLPGSTVTFVSGPFTTSSGRVRVFCNFTIDANGGTLVAGDALGMLAVIDGLPEPFFGDPQVIVPVAAGTTSAQIVIWYDFVAGVPGSTHTFGAIVDVGGGHTAGASASGRLEVLLQELPAAP